MKRAGSILTIIVAIILLFGVFGGEILDGIDSWRTQSASDTTQVVTAAGQTSANVTLSYDLFQAALAEVSTITSTEGTDTPAAADYTESTKVLLITGLDDDNTRNLTIAYRAETENTQMRLIGGFLGIIVLGGCLYFIFKAAK